MTEEWPPNPDGNRCTECDSHLSKAFIRVFGRNGCKNCMTFRELHTND